MKALILVLIFLCNTAQAVQIDLAIGQAEWQKSQATDWWQEGPASEGFYNTFNLKSTSYRVGISDYISPSVKYTLGYANLGSVSSKAGATRFDADYDFQNKRCINAASCEMVDYIGRGSVDGYYLTVAPEYRAGKWAVYGEVGAWAYFPKFSMTKVNAAGVAEPLDIQSGTQYGPVVGFGIRHERMTLSARFYKVDLNGAMDTAKGLPSIVRDYTYELSLGWSF